MMKLLLLASVLPSAVSFASGPSCACLSASVTYDEFDEEVVVETNGGCVSDSPYYPACARAPSRAATR